MTSVNSTDDRNKDHGHLRVGRLPVGVSVKAKRRTEQQSVFLAAFLLYSDIEKKRNKKIDNNEEFDPGSG